MVDVFVMEDISYIYVSRTTMRPSSQGETQKCNTKSSFEYKSFADIKVHPIYSYNNSLPSTY